MTRRNVKKRRVTYRDRYRYVVLQVYSQNLNPEAVTKALNTEPTWSHRRGKSVASTGRTIEHSEGSWSIATQLHRNASLENHVRSVWDQIRHRKAALKRILRDAKACLVVAVEPHPELIVWAHVFPAKVLEGFCQLGIDIRFSMIDPHNNRAEFMRRYAPGYEKRGCERVPRVRH